MLALAVIAAACGAPAPPPSPELITRELPADPAADPIVAQQHFDDHSDAGSFIIDAGCCTVPFALAAQTGEVSAALIFQSSRFEMGLDGGVWWVSACVPPAATAYYYQAGFTDDDDAGTVWVDRVNDAVPTSYSSGLAPAVNLFSAEPGATCGTLDAGIHSQVPDAG